LVAKRHVREPFELPPSEREAFWRDADRVAASISAGLRPDKLNYEIHGNTLEHLHLHLFPRWIDDAFWGRPIDDRQTVARTEDDRARILNALDGILTSD
jgi:diadenosine tetraphosphate (Ap4A) HIT family hydrolase